MNDPVSIASALEQPAAPLQFPFADPPAPGTAVEAAPGVFWLRMPLPYALDHINLWLLRDGDGWTIVDCGLNTDATRALWEQLFGSLLADAPVRRVIVTHYHPDHFGLAGWLTRRFDVELWMTEGEFLTAHAVCAEVAGYGVKGPAALFVRHGLDEERWPPGNRHAHSGSRASYDSRPPHRGRGHWKGTNGAHASYAKSLVPGKLPVSGIGTRLA